MHVDVLKAEDTSRNSNLETQAKDKTVATSLYEKFIMKLECSSSSEIEISKVVTGTSKPLHSTLQEIYDMLRNENIPLPSQFKNYVAQQKTAIEKVSSQYEEKICIERENYVKPKYFSIGTRVDQCRDQKTEVYESVQVPCQIAYISILETLSLYCRISLSDKQCSQVREANLV